MSKVKVGIVEGWTGALDFRLLSNGDVQDLTGVTITGQSRNRLKASVDLASDLTVLNATGGTVRLTPDTGDFTAADSPYELRFKVVDAGAVVYFPSEEAITLVVRP